MSVTPASFRAQFEEFADPQAYSDAAIGAWTTVALNLLDPNRWDTMLDYGTSLYVAHRLVLMQRGKAANAAGAIPGEVKGPSTAKGVDKVSQSFDTKAVTLEGAGFYNSTTYGIELWQLMLQFGAGPLQMTNPWQDPSDTDGSGYWFGIF